MKIKVLIVDDEPLGRTMVRQMIASRDDTEIIGECENGLEAAELTKQLVPDVVFLDIQMPQWDGFEYLRLIKDASSQPAIVFVTAFDKYAIKAFEESVADYILKPFNKTRFNKAFENASKRIKGWEKDKVNEELRTFLRSELKSGSYKQRFVFKSEGRVHFLKVEEIFWIKADGNYSTVYTDNGKHVLREAISRIDEGLNPAQFHRIARSTIVNLDQIQELSPLFRGNYEVKMKNGTKLKLSAHYKKSLNEKLGGIL